MSLTRTPRSFDSIASPSTLIPSYKIIRCDANTPKIDDSAKFPNLSFLQGPKYAVLRETLLFADKRIINVPRKRINNWNNYVVHSQHPDYLESWRDDCKVPESWIGPKLKKPC